MDVLSSGATLTTREARQERRMRKDIMVGIPVSIFLAVIPGSFLALMAMMKWTPRLLPSVFEQARGAYFFRARAAGLSDDVAAACAASDPSPALGPLLSSRLLSPPSQCVQQLVESLTRGGGRAGHLLDSEPVTRRIGYPPQLRLGRRLGSSGAAPEAAGAESAAQQGREVTTESLMLQAAQRVPLSAARDICARAQRVASACNAGLDADAPLLALPVPAALRLGPDGAAPPASGATAHERLAAFAAQLVRDDWLLRREAWLRQGVFVRRRSASDSGGSAGSDSGGGGSAPSRSADGQEGAAHEGAAEEAAAQHRELRALCAQRCLIPADACKLAGGDAARAFPLEALQRGLRAWLRLSSIIPAPLLLQLYHCATAPAQTEAAAG
jgi:hypothetical protein